MASDDQGFYAFSPWLHALIVDELRAEGWKPEEVSVLEEIIRRSLREWEDGIWRDNGKRAVWAGDQ